MAAVSTTDTVRASRWEGGWELHIEGIGVTQVTTLDRAQAQARDLVATYLDIDPSTVAVGVIPDLGGQVRIGGLEREVTAVRREVTAAAAAQRAAAERSHKLTRDLRAKGLSVTDTAAVLKVSRGRVSQLVN